MAAIHAWVRTLGTLIIGGVFALPLSADLQIHVKETFRGGTSTRVEYYKGNSWRSDSDYGYRIMDPASQRAIAVDLVEREYSIGSLKGPRPVDDPSQTIVIEMETRDTGERRQMFGHTARRFTTVERRHTEYADKPSSAPEETTTDGWYLDIPLPFPTHSRTGRVAVLVISSVDGNNLQTVPRIEVKRTGTPNHGLAVWEKTGDSVSEVTQFSEAPLAPGLFKPPEGFRRVAYAFPQAHLGWADQAFFHWQEFRNWVASLF